MKKDNLQEKTADNNSITNNDNYQPVDYQFKLLYAIGTIIVLCDHCRGAFTLLDNWFPYGTFHLGIFVFSSGYFYKSQYDKTPLKFIVKKAKSLILPLYAWNLFYALVTIIITAAGFHLGSAEVNLYQIFIAPWFNGQQFVLNLGGWFVPPLFLSQGVITLIRFLLIKRDGFAKDLFVLFLCFLIGCYGVYLSNNGFVTQNNWRLLATRTMYFLPFYSLGYFYHIYLKKYMSKISNELMLGCIFGTSYLLILLHNGVFWFTLSSSNFRGTNPIIVYVEGIIGIAFWVRISKILEPALGKKKTVLMIADNSYSIMINQFAGFMLVKGFFAFLHQYFGLISIFDMNEFHTNIWYYYFPRALKQSALIYIAAGITVSVYMQKCVTYIKNSFHKIMQQQSIFNKVQ